MKAADFSSKHDILIRNLDGSYSRMDEPYFQAEQIAPGTWKILSSGDHSYLVEGENEAVSIDTGYGAGNIRAFLQTLTDKPVRNTFNTHSHFDHTAGNGYFEKAYMAKAGVPYASRPYESFAEIEFPQDYERVGVEEGFVYDLGGGRTLEVFDIPDHTADGIALLDRKERLLFTGDEFMAMGKRLHVSISVFWGYLKTLQKHRGEFDRICAGAGVFDAAFFDGFYQCAQRILRGSYGEKQPPAGPRTFRQMPPGPNGEVVYDRMMPHPGDHGPDFFPLPEGYQPDTWMLDWQGTKIFYDKNKLPPHPPVDLEGLERKAAAGDGKAAEELAQEYLHGNLCQPDHPRALYWAEQAVRAGSSRAENVLGILCLEGEGVAHDFDRAWRLFEHSYAAGDGKSPRYLGLMCLRGQHPVENPEGEAFRWFTIGAQGGDVTSQYYLGELYEKGVGVERDLEQAIHWYRLSARRADRIGEPGRKALARLQGEGI